VTTTSIVTGRADHRKPACMSNPKRGARETTLAYLFRDPALAFAVIGLAGWLILASAADALAEAVFGSSFQRQDLAHAYAAPSLGAPAVWLGTGELGRSQIVRLLYGARVSLAVLNVVLGLGAGLVGGYFRGWIDDPMQWLISTLQAIPRLVVLLAVSALFAPGPVLLVFLLGLLSWPRIALFVRGQTLGLRQREYLIAARVVGAPERRIILRHVLPNIVPFVGVLVAIDLGGLILVESALSFLGLGIQPPLPSWGNMLSNAAASFSRGPWLVYGPASAISLTVLWLYPLGDGLRDALDPRHGSRKEA
jgi:ABC-type dipeptide/oligopeptide/nickel transport system permease subunit